MHCGDKRIKGYDQTGKVAYIKESNASLLQHSKNIYVKKILLKHLPWKLRRDQTVQRSISGKLFTQVN